MTLSLKQKSVLIRFVKGILSGIVAAVSLVTINQPEVWSDFIILTQKIGIAVVYGTFTGFILAVQKWISWEDEPRTS